MRASWKLPAGTGWAQSAFRLFSVALATVLFGLATPAEARVYYGFGVGVPLYGPPAYIGPPAYYYRPPVYVAPPVSVAPPTDIAPPA